MNLLICSIRQSNGIGKTVMRAIVDNCTGILSSYKLRQLEKDQEAKYNVYQQFTKLWNLTAFTKAG